MVKIMRFQNLREEAKSIVDSLSDLRRNTEVGLFAQEVVKSLKPLPERIEEYRASFLNKPSTGYVLVFEHEIYGWKQELGNPASEQPGAFAIDSDGRKWVATGGDSYGGAKVWTPLFDAPIENLTSADPKDRYIQSLELEIHNLKTLIAQFMDNPVTKRLLEITKRQS